jgi:hypothetical protein
LTPARFRLGCRKPRTPGGAPMDEREEPEGTIDETSLGLKGEEQAGGGFITGLVFGAILGAGLALLFAPERGDLTRRRMRRRLRSLRKDAARGLRRELLRRR